MGFLKKDASVKSARSAVTIIAEGNKFTGDMSVVGKMHIDGVFEGTIASLDTITVGTRGEIHGNVRAHQINVCGLLQGEVICDELHIEDGGRVRGTVYSEKMIVQTNGCFVGERYLKEQSTNDVATNTPLTVGAASEELAQTLEGLPDRVTLVSEQKFSDKTGQNRAMSSASESEIPEQTNGNETDSEESIQKNSIQQ
ncbi:polymer-forming cytoskeletal protein [Motiliproteus sp. MSK22-1]|uniref:bactofilin family protein n=1 Tax=Motiliproteus sp. MSK22-1 TaxID=1897630 RepID=UPI0009755D60|nr:polymer-forming cytoskeletal protein [Motiliproteus sp. MSK22-1]OMH39731.1 hypothetical protein BGP75_01325 [Motiliproteus sp. MSK22-1]